jgi:predicted NACHT family NTPase
MKKCNPSESRLFVKGIAGSGKTFFLRNWALTLSEQGLNSPQIPIYISLNLAQLVCRDKLWNITLADLTATLYPDCSTSFSKQLAVSLLNIIREGKAVILLDGADEVSKDARANMRLWIELVRKSASHCALIVASRPCDYVESLGTFSSYYIKPFDNNDQKEFLALWFRGARTPRKAEQVYKHIITTPRLQAPEIIGNPLFLTMICVEYEETASLSTTPAMLFERFSRIVLKDWDAYQGINRAFLSLDVKLSLLESSASYFFELGYLKIPARGLIDHVKTFLRKQGLHLNSEEALCEIEESSGLLFTDRYGYVQFSHPLFQEFFVARHAVENLDGEQQLEWFEEHYSDQRYERVIQFFQELREARWQQ